MKRIGLLLLFLLIFTGCNNSTNNPQKESKVTSSNIAINKVVINNENLISTPTPTPTPKPKPTPTPTPTPKPTPETHTVTLSAIGDILIHKSVYQDAEVKKGKYNFLPMFSKVKHYLNSSDITIANSESIVGGQDIGLSTYPSFNSPYEVADALKDSGIDIVTMANNHTLDRGEKAIISAIKYWDKIGIKHVGAYINEESSKKIEVITANNINFSFLNYTYGFNGIKFPQNKEYLSNPINKNRILLDIEKAKKISDVIVLNLHFGNEYERLPNNYQKELVQFAVDNGVDIIIGHHPHVLQPVEWVEGKNGNKAFVIYSLGNFISSQKGNYKDIGGMIKLTIEKNVFNGESKISIKNPEFLITYVKSSNSKNYEIIPMHTLTNNELPNAKNKYNEIKKHMNQWVPDLKFITEE